MTLWITPVQARQTQHWRGLQRGACEFISPALQPPSKSYAMRADSAARVRWHTIHSDRG